MTGLTSRTIYGIHSLTPYNTTDGTYFGMMRVLQGSELSLKGSVNELRGGSNRYAWDAEDGAISADLNVSCSEYPDFIFQLFLGKTPTSLAAEASGNASTLTNKLNSSVVAATGLLGTVTVSTAADLKFGNYLIKATGAAAFKIYWSTNIDALRGTTSADYTDDTLLLQTVASITSAATQVITGHGLTLTAGASATAFTSGDTAIFNVRPVSTGTNMTVTVGGLNDVFPEFGALCYSQKKGNGEMFMLDVFRAKASGVSLGAKEKSFSSWNIDAKCYYDQVKLGVYSVTTVRP